MSMGMTPEVERYLRNMAREEAKTAAKEQMQAAELVSTITTTVQNLTWTSMIEREARLQCERAAPNIVEKQARHIVQQKTGTELNRRLPTLVSHHLAASPLVEQAAARVATQFEEAQKRRLEEMMRKNSSTLMGPFMREMRNRYDEEIERMQAKHDQAMSDVEKKYAGEVQVASNMAVASGLTALVSLGLQYASKL